MDLFRSETINLFRNRLPAFCSNTILPTLQRPRKNSITAPIGAILETSLARCYGSHSNFDYKDDIFKAKKLVPRFVSWTFSRGTSILNQIQFLFLFFAGIPKLISNLKKWLN